MKSIIAILSLTVVSSVSLADACHFNAEFSAKQLMAVNGEHGFRASTGNIIDETGTSYTSYDVTGVRSDGKFSTPTYRVLVDRDQKCKVISVQRL